MLLIGVIRLKTANLPASSPNLFRVRIEFALSQERDASVRRILLTGIDKFSRVAKVLGKHPEVAGDDNFRMGIADQPGCLNRIQVAISAINGRQDYIDILIEQRLPHLRPVGAVSHLPDFDATEIEKDSQCIWSQQSVIGINTGQAETIQAEGLACMEYRDPLMRKAGGFIKFLAVRCPEKVDPGILSQIG